MPRPHLGRWGALQCPLKGAIELTAKEVGQVEAMHDVSAVEVDVDTDVESQYATIPSAWCPCLSSSKQHAECMGKGRLDLINTMMKF